MCDCAVCVCVCGWVWVLDSCVGVICVMLWIILLCLRYISGSFSCSDKLEDKRSGHLLEWNSKTRVVECLKDSDRERKKLLTWEGSNPDHGRHQSPPGKRAQRVDHSGWHSGLRVVLFSQEAIGAVHGPGSSPPRSKVFSFSVAVFKALDNSCLTISFSCSFAECNVGLLANAFYLFLQGAGIEPRHV